MMNYTPTTLDIVEFPKIYDCFLASFADYQLDMSAMTETVLSRRARKNNWNPALSVGIIAEGELVAITLIGLDNVGSELIAYDILTGIVPAHRGRGLAGLIMGALEPLLRDAGADAMQLEVLQPNKAAIRAYEKAGFREMRGLGCFVSDARSIHVTPDDRIQSISFAQLSDLSTQLEFVPSFEQRDSGMQHIQEELIMLGVFTKKECIAAIAYDPVTNWLMRLVTHRDFRRQGLASELLRTLRARHAPGAAIKAPNIDTRDAPTIALLGKAGFRPDIDQWEMRLDL